jgi:hypothetical protein
MLHVGLNQAGHINYGLPYLHFQIILSDCVGIGTEIIMGKAGCEEGNHTAHSKAISIKLVEDKTLLPKEAGAP